LGSPTEPFEFHATLRQLEEGLEILHASIDRLRESTGRGPDDRNLMLFELAVAEIGANVMTHGRAPAAIDPPIEYMLRLEAQTALASFVDQGPPVHESLDPTMPPPESENGRGLALAHSLLDELGYERAGEVNRWRLVKRL
jgi:serine/threonine-protein kinase RsbW